MIKPSLAFAAPHTTFKISLPPVVTSQTFSLSALGCFSAFKTLAILNLPKSPEFSFTLSTSSPIFMSRSIISFSLADVLRCSLSQGIVTVSYTHLTLPTSR